MSNFKLIKTAAALALGASVVTSAVVPTDASAASKYKIKNGKLVIAKTGKVAKGYVTYKSTVYKDGKKLTGLKGKTYYKAGKKATGTYKGAYYYKGAKKVTTGTYNGAYYVKGVKKVTTGIYNNRYYKSGQKATGTYKGAYYVKGVKKVTTGVYNGAYYVKGFKKVTTGFYNDVLYIKGKENKELAIYKENLFDGSKLNEGLVVFEEKLFNDAKLNKGYTLYKEDLYNNEKLNTGKVVFEGKLYEDAKLSKGLVPFTEEGKKELVYNDGELANGTFEVEGKEVAYENGIEVAAKVASVEAINAKEVKITFNKTIDASTLVTGSADAAGLKALQSNVVSVTRTTVSSTATQNVNADLKGIVSEDGKSITVVLGQTSTPADEYLNGTYAVTVSDNVKAKDGSAIKAFAGTVTYEDKVAPTATETTYNTVDNEVTVSFSEKLAAKPSIVRLNGEVVAASDVTFAADGKSISFAKPSSVAAGSTGSIYVAGASDVAGNTLTPFTGNVTFTNDESALSVASITQESSNTAKLVFNKSLDAASISKLTTAGTTGSAVTVLNNGTPLAVTSGFTVTKDTTDTSNKTFIITFVGGTAPDYTVYGTGTTANISVVFANNALKDVFGKSLASDTKTFALVKDTEGAKVVSSKIVNGTIEVTFNEEIAATADTSKIVLRKDGVAMSTAASAARKAATGDDAKVLVITPAAADLSSGKLPSGSYTVRLNDAAIKDAHANDNTVQNTTVSKEASAEADLTAAIASVSANSFAVTYSEEVSTATALDAKNYTLDGAALPAGTDIYFTTAGTVVRIDLPANSINIGSASTPATANLAVSGVKTSAGKTVIAKSGVVNVKDNTPAVLKSATLIGTNVIKLSFDENLATTGLADVDAVLAALDITSDAGSFAKADVTAPTGTANATASATVSGKDLIITVTPGNSNWASVVAGSNLSVKTKGSLTDKNLVTVKSGVTLTVTK